MTTKTSAKKKKEKSGDGNFQKKNRGKREWANKSLCDKWNKSAH